MTSLPERLRQETRPLHEQTEQLFYTQALQDGTLSVSEYTHLLQTHFVFHRALESAIDRYPDFFAEYEPQTRQKTPWLAADLVDLNTLIPQLTTDFFTTWSPVALLGAAYVGEGSMLGGTVIWKLLHQNQAIKPLLAQARFYQGYGPATGRNWRNFGAFLLHKGTDHADEVIAAAKQAFVDYQSIFQQTGSQLKQAVSD